MENRILIDERQPSPGAVRSAERAVEARYSVYLEEAQRLIRAGIEEIREKGNVAPRVADVVRRARLSNKAFYRHFKSKEELLLAVLEEGMQQRVADFEKRMAAASTARGRVEAWIEGMLVQATDPEEARAAPWSARWSAAPSAAWSVAWAATRQAAWSAVLSVA